jgi:hypothetical protein
MHTMSDQRRIVKELPVNNRLNYSDWWNSEKCGNLRFSIGYRWILMHFNEATPDSTELQQFHPQHPYDLRADFWNHDAKTFTSRCQIHYFCKASEVRCNWGV